MNALLWLCILVSEDTGGQDLLTLPTRMELTSQGEFQPKRGEILWSSQALFQYIIPDDAFTPAFQNGFGIRLEGGFQQQVEVDFRAGGYLSIAVNYFPGEGTFDDWIVFPIFIGGSLEWSLGSGFFTKWFGGIGIVVMGEISANGTTVQNALVDPAIEIGSHLGYRLTARIGFLLGVSYQYVPTGGGAGNVEFSVGTIVIF